MKTPTAVLNLSPFERTDDSVVEKRRSLASPSGPARSRVRRLSGVIGTVALALLLLAALSALVLMFLARLLIVLLAAGFER